MKKLDLQQDIKKKEQIKAYKEGVANQHSLFGGTVVKPVFNTPDRICFYGFHDYEGDDCFPFFYVMFGTENKLFCGDPGQTHNDLMKYVRDGLGDDFTFMFMRNSDGNQSIRGRCFLVDFDAISKQCVVFTFWKLQDTNLMNQIVYEVCKEKHFFDKEIFIANGDKPLIHYNYFMPGDYDDEIVDNSQQFVQHLLPPEQKHKVTEPYRQIRDRKLGQKLTMSNGREMPMAQYNALRYVDESMDNSKKIYLTESQITYIKKELEKARKETNTNPTDAQKEAGNYKMGRVNILGFEIAIENPKGSYRKGKDKNGKAWKCLMHNDYGYFTHTKAVDGDAVDVFLGKDFDSKSIFAIDQAIGGKFDETKVMLGFKTEKEARDAYLSNYEKGWKGLWKITEVNINDFKDWLYDGYKQRKPFSEYNEIKKKKLNENVDFYKKQKLLLGDDGDYVHVRISEAFDDVVSECENKNAVPFLTRESIDEFVDDNELGDVLQSFDIQKQLNQKFWINGKLNSRVRLRLLDIADAFFDSMELNWVKPKDIIMTGSLANYNWSKFSDIDLHIVVDFKEVDDRVEFVKDYFDSKKTIWNNQHEDLKIYGYPVELYVQNESEEHTASGVYSLEKDKWLKEPERDNLSAIKLDKERITHKTKNIVNKIDELENECDGEKDEAKLDSLSNKVKGLFDKIKGMRKDSLKNGGELSEGNIIYKCLRRIGYIGKLVDLKRITFDKINSIK